MAVYGHTGFLSGDKPGTKEQIFSHMNIAPNSTPNSENAAKSDLRHSIPSVRVLVQLILGLQKSDIFPKKFYGQGWF